MFACLRAWSFAQGHFACNLQLVRRLVNDFTSNNVRNQQAAMTTSPGVNIRKCAPVVKLSTSVFLTRMEVGCQMWLMSHLWKAWLMLQSARQIEVWCGPVLYQKYLHTNLLTKTGFQLVLKHRIKLFYIVHIVKPLRQIFSNISLKNWLDFRAFLCSSLPVFCSSKVKPPFKIKWCHSGCLVEGICKNKEKQVFVQGFVQYSPNYLNLLT